MLNSFHSVGDPDAVRCSEPNPPVLGTSSPPCGAVLDAAGELFNELAIRAYSLKSLLLASGSGIDDLTSTVLLLVGQIGWLADSAAVAYGRESFGGGSKEWLLSGRAYRVLTSLQRSSGTEGGAK